MKKTIGYGLRFNKESLKKVAKIYINGGIAYENKKDALAQLKDYKETEDKFKKDKITLVKFTIEDSK